MELDSPETTGDILTPVTSDEPHTPLPGTDPADEQCEPPSIVISPASSSVTLAAETPPHSPVRVRDDLLRPEGFHRQPLELRMKQLASVEEEVEPEEEPEPTHNRLDTSNKVSEMDDDEPYSDTESQRLFDKVAEEYVDHVARGGLEEHFEDALKDAQDTHDTSNWELPDEKPKEITMPCGLDFRPGTPKHFKEIRLVAKTCHRQCEDGNICGRKAEIGCPGCLLIAVCPPRMIAA